MEILDVIEKKAYLEDELKSIQNKLIETKKALSEALAHVCNLSAQLDATMAQLSALVHGASGIQPQDQLPITPSWHPPLASSSSHSRRTPTYTYTSPLQGPVTPRKLSSFNPTTPANRSGSNASLG